MAVEKDRLLLLLLDDVDLLAPLANELRLTTRGDGRGRDAAEVDVDVDADAKVFVFGPRSDAGSEGSSVRFFCDMSELTLNIDRLGSICSFNCSWSISEILFSS